MSGAGTTLATTAGRQPRVGASFSQAAKREGQAQAQPSRSRHICWWRGGRSENSNIHRAAHELSARATDAHVGARNKVAKFFGASSADEIVASHLERHANIVPWQPLAAENGANIRVIPVDDSGQVLRGEYQRLLSARTKIVAVTQVFQLEVGLRGFPDRTLLAQSLWLAKTPLKVIDDGAPDHATLAAFAARRALRGSRSWPPGPGHPQSFGNGQGQAADWLSPAGRCRSTGQVAAGGAGFAPARPCRSQAPWVRRTACR